MMISIAKNLKFLVEKYIYSNEYRVGEKVMLFC